MGTLQLAAVLLFLVRSVSTFRIQLKRVRSDLGARKDEISDAEALLACRSYLVKRKRIPWTAYEERQKQKAIEPLISSTVDDELGDDSWETSSRPMLNIDDEENISPLHEYAPTQEHLNRSAAAHRRWNNPTFRKTWYENRWAGRKIKDKAARKFKAKLQAIGPRQLLPQLADMSPDEIAYAIETYRTSKLKRIMSYRKTMRERELMKEPEELLVKLDRDSWKKSDEELKTLQKKRSRRQTKAYNSRQRERKRRFVFDNHRKPVRVPAKALLCIERDLDCGRMPLLEEVKVVLKPSRVARRREVMERIVRDCFGLRGKCIPASGNPDKILFLTRCSMRELGTFVMEKIHEKLSELPNE